MIKATIERSVHKAVYDDYIIRILLEAMATVASPAEEFPGRSIVVTIMVEDATIDANRSA